jgi:hypothetical protein
MTNFETKKTHPNVNWRPWDYTNGPISVKGKLIASRNSHRHGYFSGVFREFRKNKRCKSTIQAENKCLEIIRLTDSGRYREMEHITEELGNLYLNQWKRIEGAGNTTKVMLEFQYLTILYEKTLRYSLNLILKRQNEILNGNKK